MFPICPKRVLASLSPFVSGRFCVSPFRLRVLGSAWLFHTRAAGFFVSVPFPFMGKKMGYVFFQGTPAPKQSIICGFPFGFPFQPIKRRDRASPSAQPWHVFQLPRCSTSKPAHTVGSKGKRRAKRFRYIAACLWGSIPG